MIRPRFFRRLDHLLFKFGRQVFIVAELLRVEAAAAGQGTKLAGVAIEFPFWRQRMYNLDPASMPTTLPRRLDRSPMILPTQSSGIRISREWIGSSKQGRALRNASLNA